MAIDLGYNVISNVFQNTYIFNTSWIISLIVTSITLMILTRDPEKWKEMWFPVTVLWHIAGITPFILVYVISAVLFVIEGLSIQTIGELVDVKHSEPKGYGKSIINFGKNAIKKIKINNSKMNSMLSEEEINNMFKKNKSK